MKQQYMSCLLTILLCITGNKVFAYDAKIDGIYYYLSGNEATVTYRDDSYQTYSGDVVIPESITHNGTTYSVTSIGGWAFRGCADLTNVIIPNTIKSIGYQAFFGCSGLTNITIPNAVTSIEMGAFYWCKSLHSVIIPNSLTTIRTDTFYGCSGLTSVTIGNSVTLIEENAFGGCVGLTSISIPNSVTRLYEGAFAYCHGLTSVTITMSLTYIERDAFKECEKLKSIKIPVTDLFSFCNNKFISYINNTIGKTVLLIDENGKEIEELNIPEGVTNIGENAFRGCVGLKSVNIPNSVTNIESFAFAGCNSLESVTIGSGVLSIGKDIFSYYYSNSPAKVIWLTNTPPNGYSYAAGKVNYVANDQYSLSNQTVYKFLSSIFEVDGLVYVPVSVAERTCDIIDCRYDESTEKINVGETVEYKGVSMKVNQVHPYAFYGNHFVKDVKYDFTGVISVYAFALCEGLEKIEICDKVTAIGQYAFSGCKTLPLIEIPQSVTEIGNYAFQNCAALKDVYLADRSSVLTLGSNGSSPLFADCPLDSVYIGGNISYNATKNYGYSPFYRNTSLRSVHITDQETEISENEFYGCTGLKNVKIGNGVESIGNWAFSGCSSLDFFQFGGSVETIGAEAFSDCVAVTKVISRAAIPPTCGSQALDDLNKWECHLEVPKDMAAAYQEADQWKEFFFVIEGDPASFKGDLDGSGTVDDKDVNILVNAIIGKGATPTGLKGDLNNDGNVDMVDVTKLIDYILGKTQ